MLIPPLPYKWIGLGLIALAIIATAYFGIQSWRDAVADAEALQTQLDDKFAELTSLQETYDAVMQAVDANAQTTTTIIERTRTIKERIDALPQTNACLDSPAVSYVIGELSNDQQQGSAGNVPE